MSLYHDQYDSRQYGRSWAVEPWNQPDYEQEDRYCECCNDVLALDERDTCNSCAEICAADDEAHAQEELKGAA